MRAKYYIHKTQRNETKQNNRESVFGATLTGIREISYWGVTAYNKFFFITLPVHRVTSNVWWNTDDWHQTNRMRAATFIHRASKQRISYLDKMLYTLTLYILMNCGFLDLFLEFFSSITENYRGLQQHLSKRIQCTLPTFWKRINYEDFIRIKCYTVYNIVCSVLCKNRFHVHDIHANGVFFFFWICVGAIIHYTHKC